MYLQIFVPLSMIGHSGNAIAPGITPLERHDNMLGLLADRSGYSLKNNKYEYKKTHFLEIHCTNQLFFVILQPILEVMSLLANYGRVRNRPQCK